MDKFLPNGAGRVRCSVCEATAAADGKGTPIVIRHKPDCIEGKEGANRVTIEFSSAHKAELFKRDVRANDGYLCWDHLIDGAYDFVEVVGDD